MEIKVGLVEPGGEYGVPCGTCDKRAALYLVEPVTESQEFYCTKDVGPAIEAHLLRFVG